MRFEEDGPSIPDELLNARDEGRVIFFCGSGVSIHKAKLPDFFNLARNVADGLGAASHAEAAQLLKTALALPELGAPPSSISADRIFGALEWEFGASATYKQVVNALRPEEAVNVSAHQTLVDLATTPDGRLQLVTTNFDRLFERCDGVEDGWVAPRLPDPSDLGGFDGPVYLHGRVNHDYTDTDGPCFVISTSEFGRAYLAEGWATDFFRKIIDKYHVVFIGYAADDPPIRYLLEAFKKTRGDLDRTYAFTLGSAEESWRQKGVQSILHDGFADLWTCLESWSLRARDPSGWQRAVVERALEGPKRLLPHERGQVAHLLSDTASCRTFAEFDPPPPAEWLCVMDPACRFAKPGRVWGDDEEGLEVNPLDYYGLDGDTRLVSEQSKGDHLRRYPEGVWDGLLYLRHEYTDVDGRQLSPLRGPYSAQPAALSPRLNVIANWIGRVSDDPHALWWASQQGSLHPNVRWCIRRSYTGGNAETTEQCVNGWEYLFECWDDTSGRDRLDWYQFTSDLKKLGWSNQQVRKLLAVTKPYLKVSARSFRQPIAPTLEESWSLNEVVTVEAGYPECDYDLVVPQDYLESVVAGIRQHLLLAEQLDSDAFYPSWRELPSLIDEPDADNGISYVRDDMSPLLLWYASLYKGLLATSATSALNEYLSWPREGSRVFTQLSIWAAGYLSLTPVSDFSRLLHELDDELFWSPTLQRDLLLSARHRWSDMDDLQRQVVEKRVLTGPEKHAGESEEEHRERAAYRSLERLEWLKANGCKLSEPTMTEMISFVDYVPDWDDKYSEGATSTRMSRVRQVSVDDTHDLLEITPLNQVVEIAKLNSGRADDMLESRSPYTGLCREQPLTAFRALTVLIRDNNYPIWAWEKFLTLDARKNDSSQMMTQVARRLLSLPDDVLRDLSAGVTQWLRSCASILSNRDVTLFVDITKRLVELTAATPGSFGSKLSGDGPSADITYQALNSSSGRIMDALFSDSRLEEIKPETGLPEGWLQIVEDLLSAGGPPRLHVLVYCGHRLNWLYWHAPEWVKNNVLPSVRGDSVPEKDAVWGGLFWGGGRLNAALALELKESMLEMATAPPSKLKDGVRILPAMLLVAWAVHRDEAGERIVSSDAYREVLCLTNEDFRVQTLWYVRRFSKEGKPEEQERWKRITLEFLKSVWPKQISIRSESTSEALFELATADPETFPERLEVVTPLLGPVKRNRLILPTVRNEEDPLVVEHPSLFFRLLWHILSDDVQDWPYGIGELLDKLVAVDPGMAHDPLYVELKRKWDSR